MTTDIVPCETSVNTLLANVWHQPTPLNEIIQPETKYPVDALPCVVQKAVISYHEYGQQPISLIANSALANISLACQAQANVARDRYLVSPISMYFLTCGGSGDRKSAVDSVFSKAARGWEKNIRQKIAPVFSRANLLHDTWKMERDAVLSRLKRAMVNDEYTEDLKEELAILIADEPEVPLQPMLYFEDSTEEALSFELAHGWPSAALWSDEAAIVLGSHSMQNNPTKFVALLNRTWDGNSLSIKRKNQDNFTLENRRLTINLMMQPLLLQKLANQAKGICRQSGFLARCLLAYPMSTMGQRFYREAPDKIEGLDDYETHIIRCLNQSEDLTIEGCVDIPILSFSNSAKKIWIQFFDQIESGLKPQGMWCDIKDFASKAAENVARLSALFHTFNGRDGEILPDTVEQAIAIIRWHLEETKRLLAPFPIDTGHKDAEKLMRWLLSKQLFETTPRALQQLGPLRQRDRRDNALSVLVEHNWIRLGSRNNQTIIEVNPSVSMDY